MVKIIKFKISVPPPSLNNSKRPVRRGRKTYMASTAEYNKWQKQASNELVGQHGKLPELCYWSSHILIPASKTKADLDNLLKGLHDLLVDNERVPDDRYNVSIRAQFWKGDHVVIAVKQEETTRWAKIKKASKSLLKRLAMSSR